jgi:PAS domain S-box-containing protein
MTKPADTMNDLPGNNQNIEYQVIFDAMPFGVILMDNQKRIRLINKAGLEIMGFSSSDELLMTPCRDRICHLDEDNCPIHDRGFATDSSECTLKHKSGEDIPIYKTAMPIIIGGEAVVLETFIDQREEKKGLLELRESQRLLTTLMANLPGMVYRCKNDAEWTMELVSEGCKTLTGYDSDELMNNRDLSYNDIILKDDQEKTRILIGEKINKHEPFICEYRVKTKQGKIKWVWEKGQGIFDDNQELLFLEGFITDISEFKGSIKAQEVIFEISKSAYVSQNLEEFFLSVHKFLGNIIDVSNFYVAMYDKATDTISLPYQVDTQDKFASFPIGKTMTGYVIRTRTPLLANETLVRELALSGQIDIIGTPSKVWLGVPLIISDEVIGVIAVQSYTDAEQYSHRELELLKFVADQIATVILRKSAEESYHKERAYLDQLFESSPEAIVQIDVYGIVHNINSEFTKLFGYTQPELLGKNIDDFITAPEVLDEAIRITGGVMKGEISELETKRMHKDGHLIDVSVLVTPILINSEITGGYGIYRDITDRKKIEKNLITAKERAEESDKLKSAFLSNMSHEIRTPMNAILGFSTLLTDPSVSDEERAEFLRIIKERGSDLMRIIDDIIDVAKIESGQIKVEIKECQVNLLMTNLHATLTEVKRKSAKTSIVLNCLPGNTDKGFTILTDGNRLRQVMTNLIENAIKFTDEGFVEFGYSLKTIGDDAFIEFFVRDTGIGIPKESQDVVFERFRQVDDTNTRKYGGTGLGLTISKNLIRLLGGDIRLESEHGKGTTFFVLLPLQTAAHDVPETAKPKIMPAFQHNWSSRVILVAEDEDSNYFLLDRILKRTGVKLVWAHNGLEAVEICKHQKIDLVMMDIRMPVLDGYEATQIIKKEQKTLPIIAQTAYALKGEREKSLAAGCDSYISKPIDARELLAVLGKYLDPA